MTLFSDTGKIDDTSLLLPLLKNKRVQPNWNNILYLLDDESIENDDVLAFISNDQHVKYLCKEERRLSDSNIESVAGILGSENVGLSNFIKLNEYLNYTYHSNEFWSISEDKMKYLIKNGFVGSTLESYNALHEIDAGLSCFFLEINFDSFLSNHHLTDHVTLDGDEFYSLIDSVILEEKQKRLLIQSRKDLIDFEHDNNALARCIEYESSTTYNRDHEIPKINFNSLLNLFEYINDSKVRKKLFVGQLAYLSHDEISIALKSLEKEFAAIVNTRGSTLVTSSEINYLLCNGLVEHDYISSVTQKTTMPLLMAPLLRVNVKRK
jgi:hypothetical protein